MAAVESLLLTTQRLLLKSANLELAAADLSDLSLFSRLLSADIPHSWPPPLNDDNSKTYTLNYLKRNPEAAGWTAWYFLLPAAANNKAHVIGIGGFTGKPSDDGVVEVGYSVIPEYHRQGFASEAVAALVDWVFTHSVVQRVTAITLPTLPASIRVLEKNQFRFQGQGPEDGTVLYARERIAS